MIEKTILTNKIIKEVCVNEYSISNISETSLLDSGTANVYVLISGNKKYILKEYQTKYNEADIIKEFKVIEFLKNKNFPTSTIIKTLNDQYFTRYEGKVIQLQEFIEGTVYENNTAPEWLMRESALALAEINNVLSDFKEVELDKWDKLFNYDPDIEIQKHMDYLSKTKYLPNSETKKLVIKDLEDKIDMLKNFNNNIKLDLTFKNSHADYYIGQIICKDDHINAVIDFAKTANIPISWEIIRSFLQSDPDSINGSINIDNLKRYINVYLSKAPLSENDLRYMLYVYLKQLIKSDYGYKAYVLQEGRNIEKLLNFGIWRTKITRWLYNHWQSASDELIRCI